MSASADAGAGAGSGSGSCFCLCALSSFPCFLPRSDLSLFPLRLLPLSGWPATTNARTEVSNCAPRALYTHEAISTCFGVSQTCEARLGKCQGTGGKPNEG